MQHSKCKQFYGMHPQYNRSYSTRNPSTRTMVIILGALREAAGEGAARRGEVFHDSMKKGSDT